MRAPPRYPTRRPRSIAPVAKTGWSPWAILILIAVVIWGAGELANVVSAGFKAKAAEIASLP